MEMTGFFYPRICNELKTMTEKMEYINQYFFIRDDGTYRMRRGEKLVEITREQIYFYFQKLNHKRTLREWFLEENDNMLYSEHIKLLEDSFKPKKVEEKKKITKEVEEEKPKEKKKRTLMKKDDNDEFIKKEEMPHASKEQLKKAIEWD